MQRIDLLELTLKWLDLLLIIKNECLPIEIRQSHITSMIHVQNPDWISKDKLTTMTKNPKNLFLYLIQLDDSISLQLGQQLMKEMFREIQCKTIYARHLEQVKTGIETEIQGLVDKSPAPVLA